MDCCVIVWVSLTNSLFCGHNWLVDLVACLVLLIVYAAEDGFGVWNKARTWLDCFGLLV